MKQAETGDTIQVHYVGTLADGTQFDSSKERGPLQVTIGSGQVIPGFENALVGMAEGDTKSVTLEPDEAYGQRDPALVHTVERTRIPSEVDLQVGAELQAADQAGNVVRLVVLEIEDDSVTLDANHTLAGLALTFELELVGFVG